MLICLTRQVQLGDNGTSPGEGVSVGHHVAHCKRLLNVTERAKAGIGDVPKPVCGALFPASSGSEPNIDQWVIYRRSLLFGSTAGTAALTPAELEDLKRRNVRAPAPLHHH